MGKQWYTVYDPRTDDVIAIGSAAQCACCMGITVNTFYAYIANGKSSSRYNPYDIAIEDLTTGDFTVSYARGRPRQGSKTKKKWNGGSL